MSLNLATMLKEAAKEFPNKPAALFEGGRMTYSELDALSDRLARGLRREGLRRGDAVGLQLPNLPQFLIAYFGILKNGSVVVPLNVLLKAPEIEYHLSDSGARALITWSGFLAEAGKGAAGAGVDRIYVVDPFDETDPALGARFERLLVAADGPIPFEQTDPGDTAAIVYTSGTTGKPKGAELTHFQLYMNADTPGRLFGVEPDDVVLVVLPLFHVFGLSSQLNVCVRFGVTMYLMPRFDPTKVLEVIQQERITIFEGVPTMYVALLNHPQVDQYDVSSLRVGISGGAAIAAEVLDDFERRFGIVILEGYGLSETASTTSFNVSAVERKIYSVGKPIWGVEVEIWDDQNRRLPPGPDHVGELVIRGVNTMKCYHDRPESTAEAFEGGWFHTGDLGYVDDEGYFFIVDRKKDLIIRGGYNVYPREVEEVLYSHPCVAEAAVVGVPDKLVGEDVKAFVELKAGMSITDEELIAFTKERLAAYKYPRSIEFRSDLPKNATGKIVKESLASEARAQAVTGAGRR
ncbi:MAG TPA: long-chain fatty acid--CoA ligase [Acidimicrobiales bacterium]|nr:long-chain fatty acid--CoA ligase [Acidimicrobiales bacterium]